MKAFSRHGIIVFLAGILALAGMVLSIICSCAQNKKGEATWHELEGYHLSSVAWSPKGNLIAFVATDGDEYGIARRASIWLFTPPSQGSKPTMRRLIDRTDEQGIPVGLFWLDNDRIGWANARLTKSFTFSFFALGLHDKNPKRLVGSSYSYTQDRSARSSFGAPDDVYWDSESDSILFSGNDTSYGPSINILHLTTGKLNRISVGKATEVIAVLTVCGSLRDPQKPVFYVAGTIMKDTGDVILWRSDSYSFKQTEVITRIPAGRIVFPRTSPNGDMLTWLQTGENEKTNDIIIRNLKTGINRDLVTFSVDWEGMDPALGCPYSWSPDGKKIAYADGSRIKIVQVASKNGK